MKRARMSAIVLAGILLAGGLRAAGADHVYDLAAILSGTFKGVTPGNDLRLDLRPAPADLQHQHDLFLEVTGKYQGEVVRRQGLLRLELQGGSVYVGYIPHFDATVTSLSPDANRFTESEANAACGISLKAQCDGFAGETPGASCVVALRGAAGKWTIEVEPGSIRLREVKTGETLRFRRAGK